MRVHLTNLGCKLNRAELEDVARRLVADGHQIVSSLSAADLHLVNSCTVTHVAARSSRKAARWAARRGFGARTVLTGCYVSGSLLEAAQLAGVDLVVPNDRKQDLVDLIYERFPSWRPSAKPVDEGSQGGHSVVPVPYVPIEFSNVRALVKIEDGCNMRCSFCVIPQTRGRQRSRDADAVVADVARLARGGCREIVLTGVQISAYRNGGLRLATLVRRILARTEVERVRLTSIAPWDFDPALLELFETGRVCRHFHLSLQSGCDRTLRRMRRPYDTGGFGKLVEGIRDRVPGVAITTDLIVGFPGESAADFEESLEFTKAMRFAKLHAFPYSPRSGTRAAALPDPVPPQRQKERMHRMIEIAADGEAAFRAAHLGKTVPVLWEHPRDGVWRGTSDNYLKVSCVAASDLGSSLVTPTLIERLDADRIYGRPLMAA